MPVFISALHQTGHTRQGKLILTAVTTSCLLEYLPKKLNECIHFLLGIKGQTYKKKNLITRAVNTYRGHVRCLCINEVTAFPALERMQKARGKDYAFFKNPHSK